MNTPEQHDPVRDLFDQYARATAAETRPRAADRLRRKAARRRVGQTAAAGVAVAVLAVPAGWALQNAGAADQGPGPAGPGSTSTEAPPCVLDGRYALLAEGTTYDDFLAGDESLVHVLLIDTTAEGLAEGSGTYEIAEPELDGGASPEAVDELLPAELEAAELLLAELEEGWVVVELYGSFEEGGAVEVLYPCDEARYESSPGYGGALGEVPTGSDASTSRRPPA